MADQENALPPSKKRAAGREISRDNPGLDDEDESPAEETGTFKRASDEVIATRRIVKVRKHQPAAPSAPSSNPFASIRLVPPTNSGAAASVTTEKVETGQTVPEQVGENSAPVKENPEAKDENKVETVDESVASEKNLDAANEGSKPESAEEKVAEEKEEKPEDESKKDPEISSEEKKDNGNGKEGASFGSFHQLSSSQNAFTGVAGTGFSSSTFSFGSLSKEGSGTSSGSSFGQNTGFSFPPNGSSSIFATPSVSSGSKAEGTATPMKEVPVETGEENEKVVFTADSVLFEYIDGGWKERGKGELKVNVSTTEAVKARLVMRARGNYRLILNASLFPDMKLANMDKRGITFACVNSTGEGKDGLLSTFALKFKDGSVAEEFRTAVTEHKGAAAAAVKTPENSPKASSEV